MVYRTEVEERLTSVINGRWEALLEEVQGVGFLLDSAGCPAEALPFVAGLLSSDMYTSLFGEAFERECIRSAEFINDTRGTEAAADKHTGNLGAMYEISYTREGNPLRITEVDFAVTPSRYGIDTAEERAYYLRSYPRLLPLLLKDVTVTLEEPGAITNLRAIAGTNNSITLDWDDTSGARSYVVGHRVTGSGNNFTEVVAQDSTYMLITLAANTEYDCQVTARNTIGDGPPSAVITATTAPLAPQMLRSTAQTAVTIALAWNNRAGADHYEVQFREDGATQWSAPIVAQSNSLTVPMLDGETDYEFQVRSVTSVGFISSWSGTLDESTNAYPVPAVPLNLRSTGTTISSILIVWDASTDAESYSVRWKESTEPDSEYSEPITVDGTSHTIQPLADNTEYDIQVRANGVGDDSLWSAALMAETDLRTRAVPRNLSVDINYRTEHPQQWSTRFNWDAGVGEDDSGFVLQWRESTAEAWGTYSLRTIEAPFSTHFIAFSSNPSGNLWRVRDVVSFESDTGTSAWVNGPTL